MAFLLQVEGRDDTQLPEQIIAATQIRGMDLLNTAVNPDVLDTYE